jgi:hypothetical protein
MKLINLFPLLATAATLWPAAPDARCQVTAPSDLARTNGVILPYRTLDALAYTPDGRLAVVYWLVSDDGLSLNLVFNEQTTNGQWLAATIASTAYETNSLQSYGEDLENAYAPPAALLYDSQGNPQVVYIDHFYQLLVYSARTASGWQELGQIGIQAQNADDCFGAAMGPGNVIHAIAGGDPNGPQSTPYTPVHYCWTNGVWEDQAPYEGSMQPVSPSDYSVQLDYEPRPFSMVVDSQNQVHVAYTPQFIDTSNPDGSSSEFSQLGYMSNQSGQWVSEIVYNPADGHSDAGLGASIAIAPDGQPAIASFFDPRAQTGSSSGGRLFFNQRGTNGVWTTTVVASSASGYSAGDGNTGTGFAPQLCFDPAGRPHIVFTDHASQHFSGQQDEFCGNARHAWLYRGSWQIETVWPQSDPLRHQYFFPNFAVSSNQLAVLGMIALDQLDSNLVITNTLFYLNLVGFVPPNYLTTGSLRVTLAPAAAVSAGAQWQVDGGAWQDGGVTVSGLPPGKHAVAFNALAGWRSPAGQAVTIVAGQTHAVTGTYVSAPGTATLTLSVAPLGAGAASGGGTFTTPSAHTVTATPATGYLFANWTESGSVVSALASYTFTFNTSLNLVANFVRVPPPALQAALNGGKLVVSWSTTSPGFLLESSPLLGGNATWSAVTAPVVVAGGVSKVSVAIAGRAQYFRLRSP